MLLLPRLVFTGVPFDRYVNLSCRYPGQPSLTLFAGWVRAFLHLQRRPMVWREVTILCSFGSSLPSYGLRRGDHDQSIFFSKRARLTSIGVRQDFLSFFDIWVTP